MARDYYRLMARAIASLEQNTAEARQAVYEHARSVLRELVRDFEPALSASERMDEMLTLEDAIRKVEFEAAGGHSHNGDSPPAAHMNVPLGAEMPFGVTGVARPAKLLGTIGETALGSSS